VFAYVCVILLTIGIRWRLTLGAKFEVGKFDGAWNFGMWQRRVKDLLAQQGLLKALCK